MRSRRVQLRITGLVQGVFFRQSAAEEAARLGLSGWVANREDGAVEAEAEGSDEAVERFVHWCEKGPAGARVARVERSELPTTGAREGFVMERR